MLARPDEQSFWRQHRVPIAMAGCATVVCALIVFALVRPATAMMYVIVVAVAAMVGLRFWLTEALEEQRATGQRWFPRE